MKIVVDEAGVRAYFRLNGSRREAELRRMPYGARIEASGQSMGASASDLAGSVYLYCWIIRGFQGSLTTPRMIIACSEEMFELEIAGQALGQRMIRVLSFHPDGYWADSPDITGVERASQHGIFFQVRGGEVYGIPFHCGIAALVAGPICRRIPGGERVVPSFDFDVLGFDERFIAYTEHVQAIGESPDRFDALVAEKIQRPR